MQIRSFRNWTILNKVMAISVISVVVMAAVAFVDFIPLVEQRIIDGKKAGTRHVVDVAYGVISHYNAQVKRGIMSLTEAQERVIDLLKGVRYKEKEYFWINDLTPIMIMHPTVPELDGQPLADYVDPNGKHLFVEFVAITRQKGSGFVDYMWPKPGEKNPVPKLSYVKMFEPWGWIVGSGIYMDDVQSEIQDLRQLSLIGISLFALLTLTLAYGIGRSITRRLDRVIGGLREIAQGKGDLYQTKRIAITSIDEIGLLSSEFNALMESIDSLARFKKVIEEEESLAEVYSRLWDVCIDDIGFSQCILYDVDLVQGKMRPVYPAALADKALLCNPAILDQCDLCRAKKGGHLLSSIDLPKICRQFLHSDHRVHACIPLSMGGGIAGVMQLSLEKSAGLPVKEEFLQKVDKAEQYVRESLPVIEAKRLMHTLRESAHSDPLTGLHNRRFLQEYAEGICSGVLRRGSSIGLLMCDLDYFKQVNDTYGHHAGDELLKQLAAILKEMIRSSDLAIRFGGEEFVLLLLDISPGEAMEVAEKIRKRIQDFRFKLADDLFLGRTISIGVSEFPGDGKTLWQTIKYADVALYRSKDAGRNCCTRFVKAMWDDGQF